MVCVSDVYANLSIEFYFCLNFKACGNLRYYFLKVFVELCQ